MIRLILAICIGAMRKSVLDCEARRAARAPRVRPDLVRD